MEKPKLVVVPNSLHPHTPLVEEARRLRAAADDADRQIAADILRDLRLVSARCEEVREFIGIPAPERSEIQMVGVLINRALAAIERTRKP